MSSVVGLELPNAWRTAKPNDNVNFDISANQLNLTANRELWIPGATIDWASTRMINATDPVGAQDLTTKTYVDLWTVDRNAAGFNLLNVGEIQINNPADTFQYIITPSAIIVDRIVTLPLLTTNDTFVFEAFAQTLTNKTINTASNTITIVKADVSDTPWAKVDLPATTVYTDQANTFGAFAQRFPTTQLQLDNPAQTFQYIFATSAIIADRTVTLPLLTGNDTFVLNAFAATLTNKTIDASLNTITNIGDSAIATHTSTKITITNKGQLNSNIVYTDQANVFGDFAQTFADNQLFIQNPAATFTYQFIGSAIAVNRTVTLPLLTGNDVFVFESHTQALANKTLTTPTIASFINATHDHQAASGGGTLLSTAALSDTANIAYLNTTNTFGDFAQIFPDNQFFIQNPAASAEYQFIASAIVADRTVTLPLLAANDVFTMNSFAAILTNKTLGTGTVFSSIPTINDGITFTFNPNATVAGVNAGSHTTDPSTLVNGDIWYNSTSNTLFGRANGVTVDLGAAGGGAPPFTDTTSIVEGSVDSTKELRFEVDGNTTGIIGVLATAFTTAKTITFPDATGTVTVLAASQTLTNKTLGIGTVFSSIPTINDGITFTFNPNATVAGINFGAHTADPSIPVNGDVWYNSTTNKFRARENGANTDIIGVTQALIVAVGDETTVLSVGTAKITFRMPFAFTLTGVRASLTTAGTGAALVTVDINEAGSTILSTKITIDATEKTSQTAATPPVISDTALADDAEMTIDIDTIDTDNVAAGLKVELIGFGT